MHQHGILRTKNSCDPTGETYLLIQQRKPIFIKREPITEIATEVYKFLSSCTFKKTFIKLSRSLD